MAPLRPAGAPTWLARNAPELRRSALIAAPAAAVLVVSSRSIDGRFIDWFHNEVGVGWLAVAALTVTCFTGGYAAVQRDRPLRAIALTLVGLAIYFVDIVASYAASRDVARLVGELTWWAVPITLALWGYAARDVADQLTEDEDSPQGPPSVREFRERIVRHLPWAAIIWIPAVGFAAAGSVPGLFLSFASNKRGPRWDGFEVNTHWPYWLVATWAVAFPLVGTAVMLQRAWARTRFDIGQEVAKHGWYTLIAAWSFIGVAGLLFTSEARIWPEAAIDVLLAVYVALFVVLLADASSVRYPAVKTSAVRRAIGGVAVCTGIIAGVAASGLPILRAGLIAALIAGAWPLARSANRLVFGSGRWQPPPVEADELLTGGPREEEPPPHSRVELAERPPPGLSPTAQERRALEFLLVRGAWPTNVDTPPARRHELAEEAIRVLGLLEDVSPTPALRDLLNARGKASRSSRMPAWLIGFIAVFPPLPESSPGRRIAVLLDMVRRTAQHQRVDSPRKRPHPEPRDVAEAEAARLTEQLWVGDEEQVRRTTILIARVDAWYAGKATWQELLGMNDVDVIEALPDAKLDKSQRGNLVRRRRCKLDAAGIEVFDEWHAVLRQVLKDTAEPAPMESDRA